MVGVVRNAVISVNTTKEYNDLINRIEKPSKKINVKKEIVKRLPKTEFQDKTIKWSEVNQN